MDEEEDEAESDQIVQQVVLVMCVRLRVLKMLLYYGHCAPCARQVLDEIGISFDQSVGAFYSACATSILIIFILITPTYSPSTAPGRAIKSRRDRCSRTETSRGQGCDTRGTRRR